MEQIFEWFSNTSPAGAFLVIGIIGIVLLIISFLIDGIFEALDFGDGPLSLTTLAAFGALFGFVGYTVVAAGGTPLIAAFAGAGVGVLGGIGAFFLSRSFKNSTSSASIASEGLAGEEAYVTLRIPGGENLGEIAFSRGGHRYTFSARAEESITIGSKVTVLATITDSSVMVEKIKEENQTNQEGIK